MCRFTSETMATKKNINRFPTVAEVIDLTQSTNEFATKITQPVGDVFVCKNKPGKLTRMKINDSG